MFDEELNEPQLEAVTHVHGPLLVFAGAGSGKTRVITYRIANLVATHRVPPYRILAVTFTNKAAGEMRERLDGLLGHDVARDLWVGTFHAMCARLLRRHHDAVGLGRNFAIYDDADQRSVVGRIMKDRQIDDRRYPARMLMSAIHGQKQAGKSPDQVVPSSYLDQQVIAVFREYEQRLRDANACDFDDLLLHVLRLVELPDGREGDPGGPTDLASRVGEQLRRQFDYVLVDEFQDTNAVQARLVRALVRYRRNLAVVGDDDQSIYRWRGADVENIRGFARDYPDAYVVRLEQNYRSTARIVRAALGVIAPSRKRVPKDLWTDNEEGLPIEIRGAIDERDEASQVVRALAALRREGWSNDQVAILYRTHAQSRVLEEALRVARVRYRIIGGMRFFERAEIKDLLAYLRLALNAHSDIDFLRIVNVPARGIGSTTVERVQSLALSGGTSLLDTARAIARGADAPIAPIARGARKKLAEFVAIVDDLSDAALGPTLPSDTAALALERSGYGEFLESDESQESEVRLQNLKELVGSIQDYERACAESGVPASLAGFLEDAALTTSAEEAARDGGGRPEEIVTMMSVHAAKGLEFRGVLVTGLEDDLFPFVRDRGPDGASALDAQDDVEEERRLAYVAFTRARERLILFHAAMRTLFGMSRPARPSRFLRDLPAEDVRVVVASNARRSPDRWSGPPVRQERAPGERYVELDDPVELRRGGVVRHARYGDGEVIDVVEGYDPKVVASFPEHGTKTILRRFLEVVRTR